MAEPPFGHESSAVDVRRIVAAGAILAASVILAVLAIMLILPRRFEPARTREHARAGLVPPAPRLEAHTATDMAVLRTQEHALLESWGWTDDTRQFAHIPIERAMVIYARQHESKGP